jgi:tRNA (cmo5U34)-methyltransferase
MMRKSALNGFNLVAPVYDRLAKMIFGRSIRDAQICLLNKIPPGSDVLILGGGTGWILEAMNRENVDCTIWYVEASSEMITRAKKRSLGHNRTYFIHGTESDLPAGKQFDVVITNFFLDLFTSEKLHHVVAAITKCLKPGALWIATDFTKPKSFWQGMLLSTMYLFFRATSGIEAETLPEWEMILRREKFEVLSEKGFYNNFINTMLLRYRPST